jgi:hypothetical protein
LLVSWHDNQLASAIQVGKLALPDYAAGRETMMSNAARADLS